MQETFANFGEFGVYFKIVHWKCFSRCAICTTHRRHGVWFRDRSGGLFGHISCARCESIWAEHPERRNEVANKSLYVGNMSYNSTEDDLRKLFEPFGPISDVRIIGDKGFAFVEIPAEKMDEAIEATNGKDFGGRALTVNEARPREERSGGGGGRSGGGGGRSGGFGGGGGGKRW